MATIGEELCRERMRKGLTIKDVEQVTHIRATYLEAIEENNFDIIPGHVYAKGFIRNYANFLNLEGQKFVEQYNVLIGEGIVIPVRSSASIKVKNAEEVKAQLDKEKPRLSYEGRLSRRKKIKMRERIFGMVLSFFVILFLLWLYIW